MLAFEAIMNDTQIADTLTYIRNSWGNKAAAVSETDVAIIRKKVVNRKEHYQEKELRK